MAEERTLGLARAIQSPGEGESKEEIQRRMELARDSISHTVTEIKETVAHQVQAVKDSLDWREQFRKRPVAWSAGALGVGFVAGYSLAGVFKHDERYTDYSGPSTFGYSTSKAYPLTPGRSEAQMLDESYLGAPDITEAEGPGLLERFKESPAYESLSKEASSLGNKLIEELSSTAHLVVLPFLITKFKEMVGIDRLESVQSSASVARHETLREPVRSPQRDSSTEH